MAPTVSVVVATYNFEPFLARALDSVFAQDYPAEAIEVVVVDDGSTDGTPELLRAYEGRVTAVRKPNGGHLSTFNRGIANAAGDYVALLDGDDTWLPHKLSAQVAHLEAHPECGLVHGDMRIVDEHDRELAPSFFADAGLREVDGDLLALLLRHNVVTTSALLVRGSLRERFHPIPDWARVQDWWIALCAAERGPIGCVDGPIVNYRRHGRNLNQGRGGRRRAELLRAELPLRRRLLTGAAVATDRLAGADAAAALVAFEKAVEGAGEQLSLSRRELVAADRAAGEQRLAAARESAGDAAVRHLVAALAHDPWNAAARRELVAAGRRDGFIEGPGARTGGGVAARPAQARIEGARAFATLADAAELVERPELLAAYAAAFAAEDDATLVIRLGAGDEALERLAAAVAAAGLEADDAADLLAVPPGEPLGRLALRVDAVLSAALPEGPLAALPCADADGVGALAALARGEGAWCVNVCAPNWWSARSWGDLHFARALQQALHRRGRPCAIHVMDQWDASRDRRFDVVVHLKGLSTYEPDPAQVNVLWNLSHPEKLTVEECERSDLVLVASEPFAADLRERCPVPVHVLEQATDPAVFFPERDPAHERELVFVGNSRKVMRRILADLLPTERDLAVWGGDWDGLVDARHVVGDHLPNDAVRRAYSSAGIVLNDHWDDMRELGFASNRLYDAVACGALVLSDRIEGLEERFGGAVVTYGTREELATLVEHFLANPDEARARGAAGRELVLASHTFEHRVDALLAHVGAAHAVAG